MQCTVEFFEVQYRYPLDEAEDGTPIYAGDWRATGFGSVHIRESLYAAGFATQKAAEYAITQVRHNKDQSQFQVVPVKIEVTVGEPVFVGPA